MATTGQAIRVQTLVITQNQLFDFYFYSLKSGFFFINLFDLIQKEKRDCCMDDHRSLGCLMTSESPGGTLFLLGGIAPKLTFRR